MADMKVGLGLLGLALVRAGDKYFKPMYSRPQGLCCRSLDEDDDRLLDIVRASVLLLPLWPSAFQAVVIV